MSNLIKRTMPVILVLIVCIICLVSPVSATNFESGVSNSNQCFDLLDYSTMNDSGKNYIGSPAGGITFTYANPFPCDLAYVDMLINFSGGAVPGTICASRGSGFTQYNLTVEHISGNLWRAYGYMNDFIENLHITLFNSKLSYVTVYSLKVFPVYNFKPVAVDWSISVSTAFGTDKYVTSNGNVDFYLPTSSDFSVNTDFRIKATSSDWKKYDYIDFLFGGEFANIQSFEVRISDQLVPFSSTVIPSEESSSSRMNILVSLDLSDFNKSLVSDEIVFIVDGRFSPITPTYVTFLYSRGYVEINDPSELNSFWLKLRNLLYDLFGKNDSSAQDAIHTQEEINVSVNNQLVGAVEDWNTHIEVVETGYDSALTKATPALSWLASLADRIFNNMGWFGNIYFLIGLISVIMLVLSKSGLARSVGRIRRNQ